MKLVNYIKSDPKILLILIVIITTVYLMLYFQWDLRVVAIITLLLGYIANAYTSLMILIGLIPLAGPLIVKVLTIPFFWIINSLGYVSSAYAIKKGYGSVVNSYRMIAIYISIGIIIGYILGHLAPVR